MRKRWRNALGVMVVLAILILSLIDLDRVPPLWWDEGWTMTVARNWVEHGHFGLYSNGEAAPPSLSASFPTVASVALSFELFGVGVWQARLPGVVYGLGSLALLYLVGSQLFNQRVAAGAIVLALVVSSSAFLNPILVSRQVLAEMPMLFFLLSGYGVFGLTLRRSPWFIVPAMAAWGLALITKTQALPFWIASLVVAVLAASLRRRWRWAAISLIGLIGGYAASYGWLMLQGQILRGQPGAPAASGLLEITALVADASVRWQTLTILALVGLPTVFALLYALIKWLRDPTMHFPSTAEQVTQLMLWALSSSWFAWYVLFSIGWERYLMPPLFVGSLFVSVAVQDLLTPLDLRQLSGSIRQRHLRARSVAALCLLVALILSLSVGIATLSYNVRPNTTVEASDVAAFINAHTPAGALIETFDSEVLFFLARRYHYPPGVTQVEAVRRIALHQDVPINYDPLSTNPDYLVVGPFSQGWRVYDAALAAGAFRSVYANHRYVVYERVR